MRLRSHMVQLAAALIFLFSVLALLETSATAQATGTVAGTVADATGAVIPNAAVVLKNNANGTTRQTQSNGAGYFVFASVTPGTYSFVVTAPNFRAWHSQAFPLRPGDQLNFNDVGMEVAAASTEITVESTAEAARVLASSGERSHVINAKEMSTLAIVGRDATELVRMLPGFSMDPGDNQVDNKGVNTAVVGTSGPTGAFSANGAGTNGVSVISDGASIIDIGTNKGTTQNLNIDMVEEIKVSSSYGAENSRGPTVINAIGKSGSSAYHGSAYFHARDTVLNANDWMDNHTGMERLDGRYLYPGGTIGGPLYFPKLAFNKNKDKAFFFFGYENYRQRFEGALLQTWVPTLAERQGDFSRASLDAQLCGPRPDGRTNPNAILMMCQTMNYLSDGTDLTQLTGNNISNAALTSIGKASQISSGGQVLVNFLPLPNANPFTNDGGFNYIDQVLQSQNGDELHARVDYNFNQNSKMFVSYNRQSQIRELPVMYGGWLPTNSMQFPGQVSSGDMSHTVSVNFTHVFSPTLTSETTVAMSFLNQPNRMDDPAAIDRFALGYNYFGQFKNTGDYSLPALQDWSQLGYPQMLMPGGFYDNAVKLKKMVPNISENLSWVKGTHLFKGGFYFERGYLNGLADYNYYPQGQLGFAPWTYMWSSGPATAAQWVSCDNPEGALRNNGAAYNGNCMNPVGMMYLGLVDSFQQANFSPVVNMQYNNLAFYLTDSWKLTRRLTLDFGARFEHLGPWTDRRGNGLATFVPSLYDQQCDPADPRICTSGTPGITYHGLDKSVSNAVVSLPAIWTSPRFGVAFDVFGNGKTVFRGGWGVYRSQEEFQPYARAAATATGFKVTSMTSSNTMGLLTLDNIEAHSPNNALDFDAYAIDPKDTKRPIHYMYNFTIDQSMPWNSQFEIAYVGSNHENLNSGITNFSNINLIPMGALFTADLSSIPGDAGGAATYLGSISTSQLDWFRPYPYYHSIDVLNHKLYSNYNSLQASWNKQTGWVTFGANYTFSKTLEVAESYTAALPDPFNLRNDYNPAPFDRTHVVNVHYLVDLGQKVKGWKPLEMIFSGMQLSGISSWQSGPPLPSIQGYNFSFGGTSATQPLPTEYHLMFDQSSSDSTKCMAEIGSSICLLKGYYLTNTNWLGTPDVLLMPKVMCDPRSSLGDKEYINGTCYGMPAIGQNGDYRSPYIHGTSWMNHDIALMKNFKMKEKRNLQFRFAAFNFLNHPLVSFNKSSSADLNLSFQDLVAGQQIGEANLKNPTFGTANAKYGNRLLELSIKYEF